MNSLSPKKLVHNWTAEKLSTMDRKEVELIKDRALKHGASDLVELCEADLTQRPKKSNKPVRTASLHRSADDTVVEYHFVCDRERGVTELGSGQFSSGSWVVAEVNVEKSIQLGAFLALHERKDQPSYRQGRIVAFRRTPRDMVTETTSGGAPRVDEGIEFIVQETAEPLNWSGGGAGEKGYRWQKTSEPSAPADQDAEQ